MQKYIACAVLAAALGLSSCGKSLTATGTINQTTASEFARNFTDTLSKMKFDGAPTLPTQGVPSGITTAQFSPKAVNSCVTVSPDPGVDTDADGIAVERNYRFDCSSVVDGTSSWTYKGTMKIQDLDDSKKWSLGGYRIDFANSANFTDSGGSTGAYSYSGYWNMTTVGSDQVFTSDYTGTTTSKGTHHGDYSYSYRAVWKLVVTGDDPANPWLKGKHNSLGVYILEGNFPTETGTYDGTATLEFKSVDLTYDNTCSQYFKSGYWQFVDASNNKLVIEYSCSTRKAYFNGAEFTL